MKTIIAGSRSIEDYGCLLKAIKKSKINITTVISDGAKGVDRLGERYGKENNIDVTVFLAEWEKHGRSAGYKRNENMAEHADVLIAL